jgi:hypothetical protein
LGKDKCGLWNLESAVFHQGLPARKQGGSLQDALNKYTRYFDVSISKQVDQETCFHQKNNNDMKHVCHTVNRNDHHECAA